MSAPPIFHLSLQVRDLAEAEAFYTSLLGAHGGRRRADWLDVWLYGAQITLHAASDASPLHEHRHFGAAVPRDEWEQRLALLKQAGTPFVRAAVTENAGMPEEQSKFMVADPSGNFIEIKTYPNPQAALGRGEEAA